MSAFFFSKRGKSKCSGASLKPSTSSMLTFFSWQNCCTSSRTTIVKKPLFSSSAISDAMSSSLLTLALSASAEGEGGTVLPSAARRNLKDQINVRGGRIPLYIRQQKHQGASVRTPC